MESIKNTIVADLVFKYSTGGAWELPGSSGDLSLLEQRPDGVVLGLTYEDGTVTRRFLVKVEELKTEEVR